MYINVKHFPNQTDLNFSIYLEREEGEGLEHEIDVGLDVDYLGFEDIKS